jgi:tetratricopeptide (TPR) repeat protein
MSTWTSPAADARGRRQQPEATSLLGKPLFAPPVAEAARARMESDRQTAFSQAQAEPSAENIIWLGRRTAYLGRFREAITIYTGGMRLYPEDPRLYRHRGHRYISVREFDLAIADLAKAAALVKGLPDEVEPDGQPNARNVPTSTLHSNIWYHLALARFLSGDYARAADDWRETRRVGRNPDNLVSASHWLYTTLRRAGRDVDAAAVLAPITATLEVIENTNYHQLLLVYRGDRQAADVLKAAGEGAGASAIRYGVAAWHLSSGRRAEAAALCDQILAGPDWPSFGYIAAEADRAKGRM